MRKFSERLKELRLEKGLSIRQLARLTNISAASISRWENGIQDIASDYIIVLCKFLGVTTDYFLGMTDY